MSNNETSSTISTARVASEKSKSSSLSHKNPKLLKRLTCSPKTKKESRKVSNFQQIDRKDESTRKLIYRVSDEKIDNLKKNPVDEIDFYTLTFKVIVFVQLALFIYLITVCVFQLIFGESGVVVKVRRLFLLEVQPVVWLLLMAPWKRLTFGRNLSISIVFLIFQYVMMFLRFSEYLQMEGGGRDGSFFYSLFHNTFSFSTYSLISTIIHFFLILQSIELISESRKSDDFSDQIIVESLEKQTKDFTTMKIDLVNEILKDDQDFKVYLTIKDKSGRTKSLHGTELDTVVTRKFEFYSDGDNLELSRDIMTKASVETSKDPKTKKKKATENLHLAPISETNSKWNDCLKQPKPLSPRRIL